MEGWVSGWISECIMDEEASGWMDILMGEFIDYWIGGKRYGWWTDE